VHEIIPIALGAGVALACARIASSWLRRTLFVVLILLAAVIASFINGEQRGWPLFIAADVCFALAGAVGLRLAAAVMRKRARGFARSESRSLP
jgi:hypothetical protein